MPTVVEGQLASKGAKSTRMSVAGAGLTLARQEYPRPSTIVLANTGLPTSVISGGLAASYRSAPVVPISQSCMSVATAQHIRDAHPGAIVLMGDAGALADVIKTLRVC